MQERCWCQNSRCKAITCESNPHQQQKHSCFTQVKLKERADGSKFVKIKRGCTADCRSYSTSQAVQQCCNSTLCNTGQLNITHDNHTILSVEQLTANYDITEKFVNRSDADKILSDIETMPPTTSAAPTTASKGDRELLPIQRMSVVHACLLQLLYCMHANTCACCWYNAGMTTHV